jgi:hypothetical protein
MLRSVALDYSSQALLPPRTPVLCAGKACREQLRIAIDLRGFARFVV